MHFWLPFPGPLLSPGQMSSWGEGGAEQEVGQWIFAAIDGKRKNRKKWTEGKVGRKEIGFPRPWGEGEAEME